ncbi:MAG: NFACT family protein [Candidatus Micrarchaeota archaeon]|nr:NFACT family protein [Candidatus Micrarchaeota archaeon]
MKHELSMLELLVLAKELNAVKGYHIDQFYQLGERRFRIRLSSREGKVNLNIEVPDYIALSSSGEVSEEATGLAMAVRKRVSGARITGVSLLNNDRIIRIAFDRKESGGNIILEMFGRGNLIITDDKMEISLALQTHEFADRSVRKGETYKPPKSETVELTDMKAVDGVFGSIGTAQGSDRLIAYLSRRLGLGAMYIDDAIRRQKLDPKVKIKDVDRKSLDGIRRRVAGILENSGSSILYLRDGKPEDVALAEIEKYSGLEMRRMPLNEAVEALYTSSPRAETEKSADVERLEASISRQEEIIGKMGVEEAECRAKGDFISANVTKIGALIKAASDKRVGEDELAKVAGGIKVKRIDRAKRAITIEVEER